MKLTKFKNLTILAIISAFAGLLTSSSYGSITFSFNGTSNQGSTENATATFSLSGNVLTVTLQNLLSGAQNHDAGNLLNGITFNLAGVSGVSGLTAADATKVTVAGDKSYSTASVSGSTIASEWALSGASTITLTALGGGQPKYLLIGAPSYSSENSSVAGNGPHNPFILESETFSFTLSGSGYSEDDISNVIFRFGTESDSAAGTKIAAAVPEPATIAAGALLLLPLGVSALRVFRKNKLA